jgi:ribosomal protein S6
MFLFDTTAAREWSTIEDEVRRLCSRIGAELLVCVKFDERKLAYEIARRKRGTYVLAYIDVPRKRIGDLERDIRLSEVILRGLVLRAEGLTEERLAQLRAHPADVPLTPLGGDGRRHDDDRRPWERHTGEPERVAPAAAAVPAAAPRNDAPVGTPPAAGPG